MATPGPGLSAPQEARIHEKPSSKIRIICNELLLHIRMYSIDNEYVNVNDVSGIVNVYDGAMLGDRWLIARSNRPRLVSFAAKGV